MSREVYSRHGQKIAFIYTGVPGIGEKKFFKFLLLHLTSKILLAEELEEKIIRNNTGKLFFPQCSTMKFLDYVQGRTFTPNVYPKLSTKPGEFWTNDNPYSGTMHCPVFLVYGIKDHFEWLQKGRRMAAKFLDVKSISFKNSRKPNAGAPLVPNHRPDIIIETDGSAKDLFLKAKAFADEMIRADKAKQAMVEERKAIIDLILDNHSTEVEEVNLNVMEGFNNTRNHIKEGESVKDFTIRIEKAIVKSYGLHLQYYNERREQRRRMDEEVARLRDEIRDNGRQFVVFNLKVI